MFAMNQRMGEKYREVATKEPPEIDQRLSEIAKSGFEFRNGCHFLKLLQPTNTNVNENSFPDRTGYECFANSIHIDDYATTNYLAHGILFVREVFETWNAQGHECELVAVFSLDECGLKIRLHTKRLDEQWIDDNLEGYEEAVLVVDSSEMPGV